MGDKAMVYNPFESSFFTKGVFCRVDAQRTDYSVALGEKEMFVLECRFPNIAPGHTLAIIGGDDMLGDWDAMRCHAMDDGDFPLWRAILPVDLCERGVEFKFIIVDKESGYFIAWEMGDNRLFSLLEAGRKIYDIEDSNGALHKVEMPTTELFAPSFDIEPWRGRGVSLPLFSVRTEQGAGVGDFADLRNLVDWAAERDMCAVQLLPINDTTIFGDCRDSYPYNLSSTIALHPQYISLREAGELDDERLQAELLQRGAELNVLPEVDYEAVCALKDSYMRSLFSSSAGIKVVKSVEYNDFTTKNGEDWLDAFALYKALAIAKFDGSYDFTMWGDDGCYNVKLRAKYLGVFALGEESRRVAEEFEYQRFVQYHLHKQLSKAVEYAHSRGVAIKGDLPIGVSRHSVECWAQPELFNFGLQTGAPPDDFALFGQNWGFPTYNWEAMAADGYGWWKRRLKYMAQYFRLYRIDHILGFFRMWSIPVGSLHAQLGHYAPAKPLRAEEIEAFGFAFDAAKDTTPYINDEILSSRFALDVLNRVKIIYFVAEKDSDSGDVLYRFKKEYATQELIMRGVEVVEIRDALMALHNEVLFVRDSSAPENAFHPRINGAKSLAYAALDESSKAAFDVMCRDYYHNRNNEIWRSSAEAKLPELIGASDMLVCGEDLGVMPDSVAEFMTAHKILSLEVERMPNGGAELSADGFAAPSHYPYLSVATTSTHDMTTLRGWWQESRETTQRYYNEVLGLGGIAPLRLTATLAARILSRYSNTPSMLTIIPWADIMAADSAQNVADPTFDPASERINDPSNKMQYWRYRMPQTLK